MTKAWLITIGIDRAPNASQTIGSVDAQRGIPVAASIGINVTGDTGGVYALVAIAIAIAATLDAPTAIAKTERRIDAAARVIRWVTGRTALVDALLAITIGITTTTHTATAVG